MKQIYLQNTVQNPDPKGIRNALIESYRPTLTLKPKRSIAPNHPSPLEEGQGRGFMLCKGPPGPTHSPGMGNGLFPEHPPDGGTTPVRFSKPDRCESRERKTLKTRRYTGVTLNTRYALSCLSSEACRRQIRMNLNTEYHYFITTKHKFLTIKFLQT
jgi:hypothetical protein